MKSRIKIKRSLILAFEWEIALERNKKNDLERTLSFSIK